MFVASGKEYFYIFPFSGLLITITERRRQQWDLRNTAGCVLIFVKRTGKIISLFCITQSYEVNPHTSEVSITIFLRHLGQQEFSWRTSDLIRRDYFSVRWREQKTWNDGSGVERQADTLLRLAAGCRNTPPSFWGRDGQGSDNFWGWRSEKNPN